MWLCQASTESRSKKWRDKELRKCNLDYKLRQEQNEKIDLTGEQRKDREERTGETARNSHTAMC